MQGLQMRYFVLKPRGTDAYAMASRKAMQAYADSIKPFNPVLARELMDWSLAEGVHAARGE